MSGSAVDYRKRPLIGARSEGANSRDGAAPTATSLATWSDKLQAAEVDLSRARAQLERAADSESDGTAQQVAIYAANAANAAQAMEVLIRTVQERLTA